MRSSTLGRDCASVVRGSVDQHSPRSDALSLSFCAPGRAGFRFGDKPQVRGWTVLAANPRPASGRWHGSRRLTDRVARSCLGGICGVLSATGSVGVDVLPTIPDGEPTRARRGFWARRLRRFLGSVRG